MIRKHMVKLHLWWEDKAYDNNWPDWAWINWAWGDSIIPKIVCRIDGHYPIPDQCGNPDHDYCSYCMKSMPGKGHEPL